MPRRLRNVHETTSRSDVLTYGELTQFHLGNSESSSGLRCLSRYRPPFFPDPVASRILGLIQIRHPLANRHRVKRTQGGHILAAAVPQLVRFDGGLPASILFRQGVKQALHPLFHSGTVMFHDNLASSAYPNRCIIPSAGFGKLFRARS